MCVCVCVCVCACVCVRGRHHPAGQFEIMRWAIEELELEANDWGLDGATAMHWAAINGDMLSLQYLALDCDLNTSRLDALGNSIAHCAACCGHLELLQWVSGPSGLRMDLNRRNHAGRDCLAWAERGGHVTLAAWIREDLDMSPSRAPSTPAEQHEATVRSRLHRNSISDDFTAAIEEAGGDLASLNVMFNARHDYGADAQ